MIKVSVLYPFAECYRFDMDYCVKKHVSMIRTLLGTAFPPTFNRPAWISSVSAPAT